MNKKILSLLLVTVFIFMLFPFSASAATKSYPAEAYNDVCEGIENLQTEIDISAYLLDQDEFSALMQDIFNNEPMFYYLSTDYSITTLFLSGKIQTVNPQYKYTAHQIQSMNNYINSELNNIIATLPDGLDNYEKALYFHDYICVNYEYDVAGTNYYDIYNMLYYKRGVCQAYTLLYDELLYRVGIETSAVRSASLRHIWNRVNLGGKWYHVDVTWDDPIEDTFARSKHEFFLQSDSAAAASHEANDFVGYYTSGDTSLDGFSWHKNDIPFAFSGGKTYFIDNGVIKSVEISTGKTLGIYTIDAVWYTSSGMYYPDMNFSGLGNYSDILIFNTDKEIMYYDPTTGEVGVAASVELLNDNIYRLLVKGSMAYYMHSQTYSLSGVIDECDLVFVPNNNNGTGGSNESSGNKLGDVNLDGTIDANDYITLKRAYFGYAVLSAEASAVADIDHNGAINASDYILLKRAYFGTYILK